MNSKLFKSFIKEDAPQGDITTQAIFGTKPQKTSGLLIAKQNLVLSGLKIIKEFCKSEFPKIQITSYKKDGDTVQNKQKIAKLSGSIQDLLLAERICLNILQRLSGIATLTHKYVTASQKKFSILDTRKTTPGWREWEKQAIIHGGGKNHRMNLSDEYLIKDNHIAQAGSIKKSLEKVIKRNTKNKKIIIEVKNLNELKQALPFKPQVVLLDNMSVSQIQKAVNIRNELSSKKITQLEVSGGITLKKIPSLRKTGINRVSIGALTHSAKSVDISFLIQPV